MARVFRNRSYQWSNISDAGKKPLLMKAAKSICRLTGCNSLVSTPGYCDNHKSHENDRFRNLVKAPGSRKFYSSSKWTRTSKEFRRANPLCAECKHNGVVKAVELVDHVIERPELIERGLDPFNWDYLQGLCHSCHNKKLRSRKNDLTIR